MDSRVASGLSNSEMTPDPTYYSVKHTISLTATAAIFPGKPGSVGHPFSAKVTGTKL